MRFTLVSVALLALANSLALGVQGYPVLEETSSLVDRQVIQSPDALSLGEIGNILEALQKLLSGLLGNVLSSTPDLTSSAPPTKFSPTTTSFGPAAATGASSLADSHSSSVSGVPKASSTHPSRMRRQAPSSHPSFTLSSGLSKLGSATSKLGTGPPTSSHPNANPTRV